MPPPGSPAGSAGDGGGSGRVSPAARGSSPAARGSSPDGRPRTSSATDATFSGKDGVARRMGHRRHVSLRPTSSAPADDAHRPPLHTTAAVGDRDDQRDYFERALGPSPPEGSRTPQRHGSGVWQLRLERGFTGPRLSTILTLEEDEYGVDPVHAAAPRTAGLAPGHLRDGRTVSGRPLSAVAATKHRRRAPITFLPPISVAKDGSVAAPAPESPRHSALGPRASAPHRVGREGEGDNAEGAATEEEEEEEENDDDDLLDATTLDALLSAAVAQQEEQDDARVPGEDDEADAGDLFPDDRLKPSSAPLPPLAAASGPRSSKTHSRHGSTAAGPAPGALMSASMPDLALALDLLVPPLEAPTLNLCEVSAAPSFDSDLATQSDATLAVPALRPPDAPRLPPLQGGSPRVAVRLARAPPGTADPS